MFKGGGMTVEEALQKDAKVIDVRTKGEYQSGHGKGSVNIPLQELGSHIDKIKAWNKPVITVCASGMRSRSAKSQLKRHEIEAVNGGPWQNLDR